MIVRAVQEGGDDVDKMVTALEGWSFDGVKGKLTVRAEDHALLQPMFQAKLSGTGADVKPRAGQGARPGDATRRRSADEGLRRTDAGAER